MEILSEVKYIIFRDKSPYKTNAITCIIKSKAINNSVGREPLSNTSFHSEIQVHITKHNFPIPAKYLTVSALLVIFQRH